MTRYWVDANVFIWGSQVPYPLERARGYWNWFDRQLDAGIIVSHKRVYDEVVKGSTRGKEEPIIGWVKTRRNKGLTTQSTKETQGIVGEICTFACEQYTFAKATEFVRGADPFLIAHAMLESGVVVTQESRTKQVKIPAVCKQFGVECINLFEMNDVLKADLGS